MKADRQALRRLARSCGVQTAFRDVQAVRHTVSSDTLLAVLRALGVPIGAPEEADRLLRQRVRAEWKRLLEPVHVVEAEKHGEVAIRLASTGEGRRVRCRLALEQGQTHGWTSLPGSLSTLAAATVDGASYLASALPLPCSLPAGVHRLTVETARRRAECTVLSAPARAYSPAGQSRKTWGMFAPAYALRSAGCWGAGSYADLDALREWTAELGGGFVGTLPLLPCFLDKLYEPSPYAPISRLFWSEFFIDIPAVPEWESCRSARAAACSESFENELAYLRQSRRVDYRRAAALRRRVLERMARHLLSGTTARAQQLRRFVKSNPRLGDYAAFRAAVERRGEPWTRWPTRLKRGDLRPGDYDRRAMEYHLYAQWIAREQMEHLASKGRESGTGLYLDLPVGSHAHGYDTWREQGAFAAGVSVGAPPDDFFTGGQCWGFPPPHPQGARENGYRYLSEILRHHMSCAGMLRIDHVMGLHRLYWIPEGADAREGTYVHYRATEQHALVRIESARYRTTVVGEDLGTVPPYVRREMKSGNLQRMFILQFALRPDSRSPIRRVPRASIAALDTHDTATFAGFWQGLDLDYRRKTGWLDARAYRGSRRERERVEKALLAYLRGKGLLEGEADQASVLRAILRRLAAGRAKWLLIGLEDLWLETRQQNIPGLASGTRNWNGKTKQSMERFTNDRGVIELLKSIDAIRRGR